MSQKKHLYYQPPLVVSFFSIAIHSGEVSSVNVILDKDYYSNINQNNFIDDYVGINEVWLLWLSIGI